MPTDKISKTPTGIAGFDEITGGGLPTGRPTLIAGNAGCGKTLFALEFLIHGALEHGEPGVFVAFEESPADIAKNVASLGFDLNDLVRRKKIVVEYIHIERSEIEVTGDYDLEGLFIRLGFAVKQVGAKRVAIDTLEALFAGLPNHAILRAELRRLFAWLRQRKLTTVITGERGEGASLTRQGLEEYVSDCVILLDHRMTDDIATRRMCVIKYRGSRHGTNAYPFLISDDGISVLPITSQALDHKVSAERVTAGFAPLDEMLGGKGYYRGSSILVSGTAGTGKSTLAATFVAGNAARGERCLYLAFEESPDQIIRNMRGIGVDLRPFVEKGLVRFVASRPAMCGLEGHLASVHREVERFRPKAVVIDPVTNFLGAGSDVEVHAMISRLVDFLKVQQITALFTSLTSADAREETTVGVSSIMDTWLLLRDLERNGERNRGLYVLKARGIRHSNQIREFLITDKGLALIDVYIAGEEVLTGSARAARQEQDHHHRLKEEADAGRRRRESGARRAALTAQIAALQADLALHEDGLDAQKRGEAAAGLAANRARDRMERMRGVVNGRR